MAWPMFIFAVSSILYFKVAAQVVRKKGVPKPEPPAELIVLNTKKRDRRTLDQIQEV